MHAVKVLLHCLCNSCMIGPPSRGQRSPYREATLAKPRMPGMNCLPDVLNVKILRGPLDKGTTISHRGDMGCTRGLNCRPDFFVGVCRNMDVLGATRYEC